MLGISTSNLRVGGFRGKGVDSDAAALYSRIIADSGVSNLSRLNFFVKGLKTIYGSLTNVPVCYDAHWIGYKLGSGTGATAGQAAAKLYSLTVAGDAVQATAASQPLLLSHNGASSDNYWWGSGVSGNYVSTPNAAAQTLVNEFELKGYVNTRNLITYGVLANKQSGNGYQFYLRSTGVLGIYAPGISASIESTVGLTLNTDIYFKINRAAGSSNFIFYSSTDGISYTQLGATVVVNSSNFTTSTQPFIVGGDGASGGFLGRIYRLTLANSIGGAPVVDFNPTTYNASTSQTQWTSATGEVWTINTGTALTGYKGVLVDRTIVQGDGVDDSMLSGTVSISSATNFLAVNPLNLIGAKYFIGSSTSDVNILYYSPSTVRYGNTTPYLELSFTAVVQNRLALFTAVKNGVSSLVEYNNANQVTGSVGLATITTVKLFSPSGTSLLGNINLNSLVISGLADNLTTRTATYNLIRSLNNNAF
jgi:hypothetical protein